MRNTSYYHTLIHLLVEGIITADDLSANDAKIYANGQSQPSFSALTVIMYLTGQSFAVKSTSLISLMLAVFILICSAGIFNSINFSFSFSNVVLSAAFFGCA